MLGCENFSQVLPGREKENFAKHLILNQSNKPEKPAICTAPTPLTMVSATSSDGATFLPMAHGSPLIFIHQKKNLTLFSLVCPT